MTNLPPNAAMQQQPDGGQDDGSDKWAISFFLGLLAWVGVCLMGIAGWDYVHYRRDVAKAELYRTAPIYQAYQPKETKPYRVFSEGSLQSYQVDNRDKGRSPSEARTNLAVALPGGIVALAGVPGLRPSASQSAWLQRGIPVILEEWWPDLGVTVVHMHGQAFHTHAHPGQRAETTLRSAIIMAVVGVKVLLVVSLVWARRRRRAGDEATPAS